MVGPRTNGLGGKTPVFFKLTENTSDGKLWQLFPTGNETYILRTKASRTNAYLAVQSNAESSATPQESEVIMRDVNGASNEVFWKINRFKNGGYNFENVANGTGWHLQAKDFENLTMTNDIAERDIQKFQFTPFTNAGFINDPAFSSLKVGLMIVTCYKYLELTSRSCPPGQPRLYRGCQTQHHHKAVRYNHPVLR